MTNPRRHKDMGMSKRRTTKPAAPGTTHPRNVPKPPPTTKRKPPRSRLSPAQAEMTAAEYLAMENKPIRRSKYNAIPVVIDNIRFDSTAEGHRYEELRRMERAGVIRNLRLQVRYPIEINDHLVTTYVADFVYYDTECGHEVVEDMKGMLTDVFKLKQKLMRAVHGIEIRLTTNRARRPKKHYYGG